MDGGAAAGSGNWVSTWRPKCRGDASAPPLALSGGARDGRGDYFIVILIGVPSLMCCLKAGGTDCDWVESSGGTLPESTGFWDFAATFAAYAFIALLVFFGIRESLKSYRRFKSTLAPTATASSKVWVCRSAEAGPNVCGLATLTAPSTWPVTSVDGRGAGVVSVNVVAMNMTTTARRALPSLMTRASFSTPMSCPISRRAPPDSASTSRTVSRSLSGTDGFNYRVEDRIVSRRAKLFELRRQRALPEDARVHPNTIRIDGTIRVS